MKLFIPTLAAALVSATVTLAEQAPTEHQGVSVSGRGALELGAQIPEMEGFQVRIRQVTVEPGGVVAVHGHEHRPGAFFVVSGDGVMEIRGKEKHHITPGTAVLESKEVHHWVKNEGDQAHLFVFDIVPVED